jgi:hypothetical protein
MLANYNVALYGLKESTRLYHKDLACRLKKYGYHQNKNDECIFYSRNFETIIGIYVDDHEKFLSNLKKI